MAVALCVCPLGVGPAAALVPPSARPNACVAFNPNLQIVGLHEWGATTGFGQTMPSLTPEDCPLTVLGRLAAMDFSFGQASPQGLVTAAPPILILHGEADTAPTAYATAEAFAERYTGMGGEATVLGFPGEGHGWFNRGSGMRAAQGEAVARAPSPFSDTLAIVDEWLVAEGHLAAPAVAGDSWPYERTSALIAAQAYERSQ